MGCECGGHYDWDKEHKKLVCINCGKASPYQPVAIEDIIAENEKLKTRNILLERFLDDFIEWAGVEKTDFVRWAEKLLQNRHQASQNSK